MSFAKVYSAQTTLLNARIIDVEVDVSKKTLNAITIVGLPDKAVEESRDRVSAAIKNTGFTSPKNKNDKTVISLAPADLKKEGPVFDLPIALAYLLAEKDIRFNPEGKLFLGELSLDGDIRPTRGVLSLVTHAKEQGITEIFLPKENAEEAALVDGITIYPASALKDVINHLNEKIAEQILLTAQPTTKITYTKPASAITFSDIKGQETAKRGLEIAAAGGHNIALYGPPGTGKTMLARALCHILPPLTLPEVLETTAIHSIAGVLGSKLVMNAPFRSPHHTSSYVSVVGGGTFPKPGEITLAHRGVLFLDEFPEFDRRVIESLRQPLEEGVVSISRAKGSALFPAEVILIAAMNPCPCGNHGSNKRCTCSPSSLDRYRRKLSGPIMDRIDLWIEVAHIDHAKLSEKRGADTTGLIKKRIERARTVQQKRFKDAHLTIRKNSEMNTRALEALVPLSFPVGIALKNAAVKLDLSPRSYHRVIKLARTIADLEEKPHIEEPHILEALSYRPRQNQY